MATKTYGPDSKESQDQRHNPAEDQWAKNMEQRYHKTTANPSEEDSNIAKAKDREEHPGNFGSGKAGDLNYKHTRGVGGTKGAITDLDPRARAIKKVADALTNNPKKSAAGAVSTLFLAIILWILLTVSPSAMIVGLKENYTNKFMGNMNTVMEERAGHVFRTKFHKSGPNVNVACGVKVKCKFKGISAREAAKLQRAGIQVNRDGGKRFLGGKRAVTSVSYRGQTVTAANYKAFYKGNMAFRLALDQAYKPRVAVWADRIALRALAKMGIGKGKALAGAKTKAAAKKALQQRTAGTAAARGTAIAAGAGETDADRAKKAGVNDKIQADADAQKAKIAAGEPKAPRPSVNTATAAAPKYLAGTALRSVSALGGVDVACVLINLISQVGYAAKVLGALQLIRYAYVFHNTADVIKAGDATTEEVEFVADILTTPDEDGRTFGESFGYNYAAYGFLSNPEDTLEYRVGGGLSDTLIDIRGGIDAFTLGLSRAGCDIITSPVVRILSAITGIVAMIFSGGSSLAITGTIAVSATVVLAIADMVLKPILIDLVAGTLLTGDENGRQAGDAITAGTGAMATFTGRERGLQPFTKEEALAYSDYYKQEVAGMAERERAVGSELDPLNAYGFAGKFLLNVSTVINTPPTTILAKVGSFIRSPLSLFSSKVSANNPADEFEICTDEDYRELNLAVDPFCNPIYGLSPEYLSIPEGDGTSPFDPDAVIDYMHDNGHIDDDGEPRSGEYKEFIEICIENEEPLSPEERNVLCVPGSDGDVVTRQAYFRLYWIDHSVYEGMEQLWEENPEYIDPMAGEVASDTGGGGGGSGDDGSSGPPSAQGFVMPITKFTRVSNCFRKPGHTGIDFAAPSGTPVYASNSGTVIRTGGPSGDSGNYIMIDHKNGLYTNYQHLSSKSVTTGRNVSAGDRIGASGNTGFSTGPHLHFSVTDAPTLSSRTSGANTLNPNLYIPNDRLAQCAR